MTASDSLSPMLDAVQRRFADEFGSSDAIVCFAPGRVNLIGAHLDYSGGDVLPLAVDVGVYVAARMRRDGKLRLGSLNQSVGVEVECAQVGDVADASHGWARYPIGVWREFTARTGTSGGVDLVFGGDVPMASGLSSSAAIEVATVTALCELHGIELPGEEVAAIAHAAETEYVGLQCGIMDQFASALGEAGHAVLLHCHDRTVEHVPVDPDAFEVLVVDTKKPRNLSQTEFNTRVAECAAAYDVLREKLGPLSHLAAFPEERLPEARAVLDDVAWRRVYHVVTEMRRVALAVESLRRGDVARLGALISASHESTRAHYEVSCDELDTVTQAACEHERTFGARLTGAGFGGCAFALVEPNATGEVEDIVRSRYVDRFGVEPGFLRLRAGSGPRRLR